MFHTPTAFVSRVLVLAICVLLVGFAGCSSPEQPVPPLPNADYIPCSEPRAEICTREFNPVCASRDTGIRCVTTPCDSSEWVTRSNACTACSDPLIYGHRVGACPKN